MPEILIGGVVVIADLPTAPFFLPPHETENSGVDFLGLRQVNLDMMGELIPSLNNVVDYVRPFTLLSWIHWKFHDLCVSNSITNPTLDDLILFRQRIEILFTWGATVNRPEGRIPGTGASKPSPNPDGTYPLTFEAWNRKESSTSLIAALWYGPASKIVTGLGFLEAIPGKPGAFRPTKTGVSLARILDEKLRTKPDLYEQAFDRLGPVNGTEDIANELWGLWRPDDVLLDESEVFSKTLYDPAWRTATRGLNSRRSATLSLFLEHLRQTPVSQSADEIREGAALSILPDGRTYDLPADLIETRNAWLILQMRQLQRLCLEGLLSWFEQRVIEDGLRETSEIAERLAGGWDPADFGFDPDGSSSKILGSIAAKSSTVHSFIKAIHDSQVPNPFRLIDSLVAYLGNKDARIASASLAGLHLCAAFAGIPGLNKDYLAYGGARRLSLLDLYRRLSGLEAPTMRGTAVFVLETLIVSQHFATAVNRFDGQKQRLKFTIEEHGLTHLTGSPTRPSVTADRLPTFLRLAEQSKIILSQEPNRYSLPPESSRTHN
ncbi:hypothetical protein EOI86_22765 [Hwanghaeella grinnelliae]|uniref:Uncharacterized protein n=1 Tax=Hwanghaeella grinnelliae TaxID=2500179 RepID=A0A437QHF3_9PROT|nr:hypothetical protein [Hwanghaeella grinnelliae]RVU33952.1 hypothetical protein EOI86_22765 [Hwanghaeella grinnelliae]